MSDIQANREAKDAPLVLAASRPRDPTSHLDEILPVRQALDAMVEAGVG